MSSEQSRLSEQLDTKLVSAASAVRRVSARPSQYRGVTNEDNGPKEPGDVLCRDPRLGNCLGRVFTGIFAPSCILPPSLSV